MCYHASTPATKALKAFLSPDIFVADTAQRYHVSGYAHPEMPVMLADEPQKVQPVSWGFIPPHASPEFAADFQKKGYSLNAKAETIFSLPLYKTSAQHHRCLVFVNGFFEWKHEKEQGKDVKRPYFIKLPGQQIFALGGLYSRWQPGKDEEAVATHNILTTPANELMATIHNTKKRMPLIIAEKDWPLWLDDQAPEAAVKDLLKKYPEGLLEAHEVNLSLKKGIDTNVPDVQEPLG